MQANTYEIIVDVSENRVTPLKERLKYFSGDYGKCAIDFKIKELSQPYDLSYVDLKLVLKSDTQSFQQDLEITDAENGFATITLDNNIIAKVSSYDCQLQAYDRGSVDQRRTIAEFSIRIAPSYLVAETVEGSEQYDTLTEFIVEAKNVLDRFGVQLENGQFGTVTSVNGAATNVDFIEENGKVKKINNMTIKADIEDESVSPIKTTFLEKETTNVINFINSTSENMTTNVDEYGTISVSGSRQNSTLRIVLGTFTTDHETEYIMKAYNIEDSEKPTIYICNGDSIVATYTRANFDALSLSLDKNTEYTVEQYPPVNTEISYRFILKLEKAHEYSEKYIAPVWKIKSEYSNTLLKGKKLSILGCSIDSYAGYIPSQNTAYYSDGHLGSVEYTGWKRLLNKTGMQLLVNNSWSGSKVVTTDYESSAVKRCVELDNGTDVPDVIIIGAFAFNDWINSILGTYTPITDVLPSVDVDLSSNEYETYKTVTETYKGALATIFYRIQEKYPLAKVYAMDAYNYNRPNGYNPTGNTHEHNIPIYNNALYEIADYFGVEVIKISKSGINAFNSKKYCVESTSPHLHPNKVGHEMIFKSVYSVVNK